MQYGKKLRWRVRKKKLCTKDNVRIVEDASDEEKAFQALLRSKHTFYKVTSEQDTDSLKQVEL